MNPFEQPPASPPVSTDPPQATLVTTASTGRRGRMALVALATAGMLGGGVVAVSQFASADEPVLSTATPSTVVDEPTGEPSDDASDDTGDVSGEIVIDLGNGDEPVVLDIGELGESFDDLAACLDLPVLDSPMFGDSENGELPDLPFFDGGSEELQEMIDEMLQNFDLEGMLEGLDLEGLDLEGLDLENFDLGDLDLERGAGHHGGPLFDMFAVDGTHVTIIGPDGLSVIDLGDGDGSVTITQADGEVTISTDGDATVQDLPDFESMPPFGDFDMGEFNLDDFNFDDFDMDDFDMDGLFGDSIDMSKIESCLEDLG